MKVYFIIKGKTGVKNPFLFLISTSLKLPLVV